MIVVFGGAKSWLCTKIVQCAVAHSLVISESLARARAKDMNNIAGYL